MLKKLKEPLLPLPGLSLLLVHVCVPSCKPFSMAAVWGTLIPSPWDTGTEGCSSGYWLGFDPCCPVCHAEPLGAWGAPKNPMGRAVLLFTTWGRAPGRARGAERGCWAWDSMGQAWMKEGGYLVGKVEDWWGREGTLYSLGLLHLVLPTYRCPPGLAEMDKFSVLLAG